MSRANAVAITPLGHTFPRGDWKRKYGKRKYRRMEYASTFSAPPFPTLMLLILPVFTDCVWTIGRFLCHSTVSLHHLCYRDRDSCATGFYYRAQMMKAPAVQVCKSCRRKCLKLSSLCVLRTLIKKVFHLIYKVGQKKRSHRLMTTIQSNLNRFKKYRKIPE